MTTANLYPWKIRVVIFPDSNPENGERANIEPLLEQGVTLADLDPETAKIWKDAKLHRISTTSREILNHYRQTLRTKTELWHNPVAPFDFGLLAESFCYEKGIEGSSYTADYDTAPYLDEADIIDGVTFFYRRTIETFIRTQLDAPKPE